MYICIYVDMYICVYVYIYVDMYICIYVYIYIYMYMYMSLYTLLSIYISKYPRIRNAIQFNLTYNPCTHPQYTPI